MFAAVFFFCIGLLTDPLSLIGVIGLIAVAVVVTAPAKLISGFYSGRIYDLNDRRSLRVGFGLVTRGEFSLIIAAVALAGAGGTVTAETAQTIYAFTVGYVLVMSILGTVLMQSADVFDPFVTP
jgi:CPA2 family monovalent cation:H+ antiporter-2